MLGGSSAINGLVYVRGQALDYDTWAQMGNRGWSYDEVLPFFKRLEAFDGGDDQFRGRNGPLRLTEAYDKSALYDAWFAAGEEVGLPRNPDYNGASQEGICRTQTTIHDGWRMSTSRCYIDPARRRANLDIQCDAHVESLLLEGKRCTGLRYRIGHESREARARCEVVLCAGSINSPQILELSGIGRPEILQAQGVTVQHALPGVGENLRDHYVPRLRWEHYTARSDLQRPRTGFRACMADSPIRPYPSRISGIAILTDSRIPAHPCRAGSAGRATSLHSVRH